MAMLGAGAGGVACFTPSSKLLQLFFSSPSTMPVVAWPGVWWRRDARTSCSAAVAVPVAKRRRLRGGIPTPKQTAPTRPREAEGAAAPAEGVRFKTGDLVIIDGLTSKPALNGRKARVRGSDPPKGRLVLELLQDGTQISVKYVNCRKANVEEANEVVSRLEHELAGAQARLQARSDELSNLAKLDELEATAAAPQQASGEEEIEEICTPSVAADLRRERRAQGTGCEAESSEGEGEESEEGESDEFDSDASSASDDGIGAFPFY